MFEEREHRTIQRKKEKGSGASLTGDVFSTIHDDLVTELFIKRQRAPLMPSTVVLIPILFQ